MNKHYENGAEGLIIKLNALTALTYMSAFILC